MKWGVRRYQNADGSLTARGEKHYSKMPDDKLQKTLYKQVKQERTRQSNWSNKWNVNNTIGKNSKAAQEKFKRDNERYKNSDYYKQAVKKVKTLDKLYDEGKIDPDEYDDKYEKIRQSVYNPEFDRSVRYTDNGRKYSEAYVNKYGKDLNIGYLKDLGYNDEIAKKFTERVLRANKKMLNGM